MARKKSYTNYLNQQVELWTIIDEGPYYNVGSNKALCICRCVCGTIRKLQYTNLFGKSGKSKTKSCGCYIKSKAIAYSSIPTNVPEYYSFRHMHSRCYNQNDKNYNLYGGRGIKVCDRWKDFKNILS